MAEIAEQRRRMILEATDGMGTVHHQLGALGLGVLDHARRYADEFQTTNRMVADIFDTTGLELLRSQMEQANNLYSGLSDY
jgi:hypothetical protein